MSFPNDKKTACLRFHSNKFWHEALRMLLLKIFRASSCRISTRLEQKNKPVTC